ncbi:MAG: methyltransferase domain-containing protein [Oscillospiraceae bacterium]|nr:methyltransferase domain-containing protein [Oscillospiraceae bacterium]
MIIDFFLSHQHEDLPFVASLAAKLEEHGLKCWYAPRNVNGKYARSIANGISNCKVFLLILNHRSAVSDAVLNEVELAHNVSKSSPYAIIQPICTENLNLYDPEYQEMLYYIQRMHFIHACDDTVTDAIVDELRRKYPHLFDSTQQRHSSKYVVQHIEDERLALQNEILRRFDDDVYQRVMGQYSNARVLDVGCGTGDMLIGKISSFQISAFLGIDRSSRQIETARAHYGGDAYTFCQMDVEGEDFSEELRLQLGAMGIDSFDVINISMLLLHLNDPMKLLTRLYSVLSEDGIIIIRDIDDGLNFAYPDPTNAFERIYRMCEHDEQSGNRRNGRQIYTDLHHAGYTKIKLEHQGLSSIGMTLEERNAFFNMYFPFTLENAQIMLQKYPWNTDYKVDYEWYKKHFDNIHEDFLKPEFIFSLGFVSYTAQK